MRYHVKRINYYDWDDVDARSPQRAAEMYVEQLEARNANNVDDVTEVVVSIPGSDETCRQTYDVQRIIEFHVVQR